MDLGGSGKSIPPWKADETKSPKARFSLPWDKCLTLAWTPTPLQLYFYQCLCQIVLSLSNHSNHLIFYNSGQISFIRTCYSCKIIESSGKLKPKQIMIDVLYSQQVGAPTVPSDVIKGSNEFEDFWCHRSVA
jgi:hypothetical protein